MKTLTRTICLAAEQGIAYAQFSLGAMYAFGYGVPQDNKTAVKWYTLAAEQGELDSEQQGELDPLGFEQGILVEDELELLSQIINRVNETYGSNLSEEDKIDLLNLSKRVDDNEELKTIMEGDSSMTNKKQYFKDTIDRILLSYVNERFDFYKKMEDQRVKGFVVNSLYENYTRNLNQETIG